MTTATTKRGASAERPSDHESGATMQAIIFRRYGGPEVLEYVEAQRPTPGPGEVLVRVRAASVNAVDYRMMRADPFLVRVTAGLFRPKSGLILGTDVAGVVEEVGEGVRGFAVGDEVFGHAFHDEMGTFAEYVCVSASGLTLKPAELSFEEAAAVPLAGITALQAVRDLGGVERGQSVLVQGAGGGVGTFVVQIAKAYGAEVTAVCGAGSVDLVNGLGADRVLDYAEHDFTSEGTRYDVILGVNGHRSLGEYKQSLKPGGRYVMVGGDNRQIFDTLLFGRLRFLGSGKTARALTIDKSKCAADLAELRELLASGRVRPVIDRTYPLAETAEAMRYVEQHHVRGKVVIGVGA